MTSRRAARASLVGLLALAATLPAAAAPPTDEALLPPEQHGTPGSRTLAAAHRQELVQFHERIYYCLPWLMVQRHGIGFRQPRGAEGDAPYLSVWLLIDQFDDGTFAGYPQERRVSTMFSRYGVEMLRRMAALPGIAADTRVRGFSVVLSWPKPGVASRVSETIAFFADREPLREFLANRLAPAEFARRARFSVFDGKQDLGRLPLEVVDDAFLRTFQLPGYEPPKGVRC